MYRQPSFSKDWRSEDGRQRFNWYTETNILNQYFKTEYTLRFKHFQEFGAPEPLHFQVHWKGLCDGKVKLRKYSKYSEHFTDIDFLGCLFLMVKTFFFSCLLLQTGSDPTAIYCRYTSYNPTLNLPNCHLKVTKVHCV